MIVSRNGKLKEYSKSLRRNATREEKHLWYDYLQKYPVPFYRQKIVGDYILDFYCPRAKLAIELDGSQHYESSGRKVDARRTNYLESLGICVIRFSNLEVQRNFEGVCLAINRKLAWMESEVSAGEALPPNNVEEG